jgi:ATP-dependent RNA helicase RhlE
VTSFSDLGLVEPLAKTVHERGYAHPTPIQIQSVPRLLESRDLLGCARTGTGKTAAFALPILQHLCCGSHRATKRAARALVLVPTRELAAQVADSFRVYGKRLSPSIAVVYGGVGQGTQVRSLTSGVDVLVATPGRLLDLMEQGHVKLDRLEILVLDEADRMLDLGFLPDVKKIIAATPKTRQTLLFSATMPPQIAVLAERILKDPVKVFVSPAASTVDEVDQRVHFVPRDKKPGVLARILADTEVERALVFTRTKRGADRVARRLGQDGIAAEAIHGNKSQGARERTLSSFRRGRTRVLVATDIAARGIDIDGITHVINFEVPNVPESYVHRIGRTARAGSSGVAISLCDGEEREFVRDIERLIRRKLRVVEGFEEDGKDRRPARHARGARVRARAAGSSPDHRRGGSVRHGASSTERRSGDSLRQRARACSQATEVPVFGTGIAS